MGAVAYDGVKRLVRGDLFHGAAVIVTSWGLRGARLAETGAAKARFAAADILSEARDKVGGQSPAPATASAHNYEH